MDSSAHFASVTAERMLLDMLLESSSHAKLVQTAEGMFADPDKDQPDWKACVDNRDCGVFVSWDPPSKYLALVHLLFLAYLNESIIEHLKARARTS